MADMLAAALDYAKRGLPVFPVSEKTKKPLTANGFKDATTNEAQIRAWWTKRPKAMIGMPTGKASGLWTIDLDVDPSKGLDGIKEFENLSPKTAQCQKHGAARRRAVGCICSLSIRVPSLSKTAHQNSVPASMCAAKAAMLFFRQA
jgi:Bifunctional DNA primase/polymerase, N-terminal